MLNSDTLATVYKYLKPLVHEISPGKQFELYTSFPKKSYPEQMLGTLKELGLVPTCALVVKYV